MVLFACGAGAATLLMTLAARELRAVFGLVAEGGRRESATRVFGYLAGGVAFGVVFAQAFGMLMSTGGGPRAPLEFLLLAAILGPTAALWGRGRGLMVFLFVAPAAVGLIPGLLRVPLPLAGLLVLGSLIVLGGALAVNRPLPTRWALPLGAVAVAAATWSTGEALAANVSRAPGVTAGVVLVAICIFFGASAMARDLRPGGLPLPLRILGGGVALLALGWRMAEYRQWFDREVATEAALGLARVPLLALGLVALAVVVWPRRRRVARELGLERDPGGGTGCSWGLPCCCCPTGQLRCRTPSSSRTPPAARMRAGSWRGFSRTPITPSISPMRGELFDTLAGSVTGGLVDDLYLDGRRRLTAGTREGTRVTVRDVGVLEIGDPFGGTTAEDGFSYDCRWAVVARVQHLQHIHHRRNIYNGVLTLQSEGGRWKIAGVELLSEDRVVVPWKPS